MQIFVKPEVQFDKKAELYDYIRQVQSQEAAESLRSYIHQERKKIGNATELAGEETPGSPVHAAIRFWSQALDQAEHWLASQSELALASCLALATQADEQLQKAVHAEWEQTRNEVVATQWQLRLQGFQPPPPASGSAPPAPESGGTDWYPVQH